MTSALVSLAQAGIAPPKHALSRIVAEGITAHFGGPSPWSARNPASWSHDRCPSIWRAWDAFHRTPGSLGSATGGVMIAYTSGICPHGVRYEGRGPGYRTAAQGTNDGNDRSYACVYIAGSGDVLTDAAKWAFLDERDRLKVPIRWTHDDWHSTECPGLYVRAWVKAGCPVPGSTAPATPALPVLPPRLATQQLFILEDDMRIAIIDYPVPALEKGYGYWDLDGSPGRPRVAAGHCIAASVNGADTSGHQEGQVRVLQFNDYTRLRLADFSPGATPTIVVAALVD